MNSTVHPGIMELENTESSRISFLAKKAALSIKYGWNANSKKGLPLTVAIVSGILGGIEQDCWKDVANRLSIIGSEHSMKSLDLSYSHLPDYMKPCLLYFGAFQEDREISVRKLILLWISEGFVQKAEEKKFEDVFLKIFQGN